MHPWAHIQHTEPFSQPLPALTDKDSTYYFCTLRRQWLNVLYETWIKRALLSVPIFQLSICKLKTAWIQSGEEGLFARKWLHLQRVFKGRRSFSEGENHPRRELTNLPDEGKFTKIQKAAFSRQFPHCYTCAKGMIFPWGSILGSHDLNLRLKPLVQNPSTHLPEEERRDMPREVI